MPKRTLVTYGTDGFRDFVVLPDGQSYNLGSVSVLNLVVALARTGSEAKRSLDRFLANQEATLAVDLGQLFTLLEPKRARWAKIDNALISETSKSPMTLDAHSLVSTRVASEEKFAAVDMDMLRELEVYLDNESSLQAQWRAILKSIIATQAFDAKSSQGYWLKWVDAGAKAYAREFGTDVKDFSEALKMTLAGKLAQQTTKAIQNGEYDHLKSASDQQEEDSESKKEASLLNEGLAHAVMAKVERALQVCSSTNSKFASSGKTDLLRISSELSALLETGDLSAPSVRASLLTLTKKADHVLSFFSR